MRPTRTSALKTSSKSSTKVGLRMLHHVSTPAGCLELHVMNSLCTGNKPTQESLPCFQNARLVQLVEPHQHDCSRKGVLRDILLLRRLDKLQKALQCQLASDAQSGDSV